MSRPGPEPRVHDDEIISVIESDERPFSTAEDVADSVGLSGTRVRERLKRLVDTGKIQSATATANMEIYWVSWESN
jgi:DNA-binding Lrp family transcriptional regulator